MYSKEVKSVIYGKWQLNSEITGHHNGVETELRNQEKLYH